MVRSNHAVTADSPRLEMRPARAPDRRPSPQLFAGAGFESFEPDEPLLFSLFPLPSAAEAEDDFDASPAAADSFEAESFEDESLEEESFDELSALFAAVSRWRLRVP
jgi:hypothetical protein